MEGLVDNVVQNIVPFLLFGSVVAICIFLCLAVIPRMVFLVTGKVMETEEKVKIRRLAMVLLIVLSVVEITAALVFLLTLSNPLEKKNAETVGITRPDPEWKPRGSEEVMRVNRKALTESAREKAEEAERDNLEAMEKARNIFTGKE